MGDELHIGVIGAGGRGLLSGHVHEIEGGGARLVAGADVIDAALDHFKERFGADVMVTHDYRDILARDDIAAVFVSTPDYLHEEHAVAALEAGKHVYLEKPMAITIEGCDRILRTAMEAGVKLYVGHNMRHMSVIQKMKDLVDAGEIGEVKTGWCRHFCCYGGDAYFKDWHAEREKSTSLLLQKGTHDIDVLHWICGGYSRRVTAMGNLSVYNQIEDRHPPEERGDAGWHLENWPPLSQKGMNPVIDVEDLSMMLMELDNGVLCSYQQCHYTPDGWRNYTIIGTEGRIENFGDSPGETTIKLWNEKCYYGGDKAIEYPIPHAEGGHGGADPEIVKEFVEFVRDDGPISVSAIASRNSVAAGCMATESLRNGSTPREIPPVDDDILAYFSDLGH